MDYDIKLRETCRYMVEMKRYGENSRSKYEVWDKYTGNVYSFDSYFLHLDYDDNNSRKYHDFLVNSVTNANFDNDKFNEVMSEVLSLSDKERKERGIVNFSVCDYQKPDSERLKVLLSNAICFMIENNMNNEELNKKELCEEIADYLGSSVIELANLEVLDYEELTEDMDEENCR